MLTKLLHRYFEGSIEPPLIFVTLILYRSDVYYVCNPLLFEAWPEIMPSAGMLFTWEALLSTHSSAAMFSVAWVWSLNLYSDVLRDYDVR